MVDYTKSRYTRLAEALGPQDPALNYAPGGGLSQALLGGLRGYSTARGQAEDEASRQAALATQQARQERMDTLGFLKAGVDPSKLDDQAYIDQLLAQQKIGDPKGEFASAMQYMRSPEFQTLSPEDQQRYKDFVDTKAKSLGTLAGQARATQTGKLGAELEYKPQIEGAVLDVQLQKEPGLVAAKETAKLQAQGDIERQEKLSSTEQNFETASKNIDAISATLEAQPELVGFGSEARAFLGKAGLEGLGGFTPEQMKERGKVVNQITQAGLQMIGSATEAGLSGINSIAEAKRIIGNLTPDSSAAEIQGALEALKTAKADALKAMQDRANTGKMTPIPTQENNDPLGIL